MDVSIIEAGDKRFTLTVDELAMPSEEIEVIIGADPDKLPSPHRHQFRPGSAAVHGQNIGIMENKVCCWYIQI